MCVALSAPGAVGAFGGPMLAVRAGGRARSWPRAGSAGRGAPSRHVAPPASSMSVLALRGGQGVVEGLRSGSLTVGALYQQSFWVLALACLVVQVVTRARARRDGAGSDAEQLGAAELSLRNRFLAVFWLYKMADWLQGPYFYDVYASKLIGGLPVSADGVAKLFLAGFATTMLVGPFVGGLVDALGRKKASLAFAVAYALGALSTAANSLPLLYAGRFFGGVGTSLLFSAPEAWLIGQSRSRGFGAKLLSQTFGLAYLGDSVVAMLAGQLAGKAAARSGPVAPFVVSTAFLAAGAALVALTWRENYGEQQTEQATSQAEPAAKTGSTADTRARPAAAAGAASSGLLGRVGAACRAMASDRRIMLVGCVQAAFEGAMYTFVLVWPPALKAAVAAAAPAGAAVPFGAVFSCFMACCMLGSSAFSSAARAGVSAERTAVVMLALGCAAMGLATAAASRCALLALSLALFAFEACVGVYFPTIGTLRGKFLPDEHRGAIMNLFGIPLNLIVVTVFLSIGKLKTVGALGCATAALGCALLAALGLQREGRRDGAAF
ncbi:hypothetical protein KFE25_010966 [Diacronema lutheri]|uniref:Molybdate-anion transporter n=2 Tax=Diacronema lutheri TaxID=2081491 RepID=A0A8J5XFJ5_DIALT|nr:hypothetical protein KFE25_010966 [Diacronema lutheri]